MNSEKLRWVRRYFDKAGDPAGSLRDSYLVLQELVMAGVPGQLITTVAPEWRDVPIVEEE